MEATLASRDSLGTDLSLWEIGPYHAALPGAMRLALRLDGEVIVSAQVETGYLHKGLEKSLELHPWQSVVAYADRLDPEGAAFGELAVCLAVEEIGNVNVPLRAQSIRAMLSELARICCHMGYIVRVARTVGAETIVHYVLRDRERILDLFELLTGARFSLNFLRYGGVRSDVTEGFIERILEACELIRLRIKEYNDLFTFNHAFLRRTAGVAVVAPELARATGMTGPNARASGVAFDVRKAHPYSGVERFDFAVPTGSAGDVHDRFVMRLREIAESVEILRQAAEALPPGEFASTEVTREFRVPAGEAYSRIETSRGMLGCHVVSDGGRNPARVQFQPPSRGHLMAIPRLVQGIRIEDLPVVLASLDPGIPEVDR